MKFIALLFTTIFATVALAQPAYLKDATITVTLKDGKTYTYSANEYMVVKRGSSKSVEQKVQEAVEKAVAETKESQPKNIVSLEIVNGQKGQSVSDSSTQVEVETKRQTGVGLQYQRRVSEQYYLGIRADTLGNVGGSVGVGF